jgi:hypothetical protein
MGRNIKFGVLMPDGTSTSAIGRYDGTTEDGLHARVYVQGHPVLKDGHYNIVSKNGTQLIASLDDSALGKAGIDAQLPKLSSEEMADAQRLEDMAFEASGPEAPSTKELKKSVTGADALANIRSTAAKQAKDEGRFPIMRDGKDAERAAKEQYTSLFEDFKKQHPDLASQFASKDDYWNYLQARAADTNTQWADNVNELDPVMKASNSLYAEKVLGLEPGGTIEMYRNAINHKNSEGLSAAGYMSFDKKMAWDYNSTTEQLSKFDGRYTVLVKPDEVKGLLGYSKAEDEFGVVVGPDVTSLPGRATRVGDLEVQTVTPYIDDTKTFARSGGGSPFRHFSVASQFNFPTTEKEVLPGTSYADFYADNKLEAGAIPNKFDELYGAGEFAKLKTQFGQPSYDYMKSMFVELPDGSHGFDPRVLQDIRSQAGSNQEEKLDFQLKFVSTIQELHGKPFMVSNAHSMDDPRLEKAPEPKKPAIPSPAMIKPQKPQAAPVAPKPSRPSATTNKPKQVPTTVYDRNKQPIVKGDKATFFIETEDGNISKIEGTYTGQSTGSLKQVDLSTGARSPGRPIFRVEGQPGLKDGDYPIKMGTINLDEDSPQFEKTAINISGSLERIERINNVDTLTPLTDAQSSSLFDYTTQNGFEDIRTLMMQYPGSTLDEIAKKVRGDEDYEKTIADVKNIETAIYSSPLENDTKLFRGVEIMDDADFEAAIRAMKVGETIHDSSLQSTSSNQKIAEKFAGFQGFLFEIDAPAGSPALEVAPFHTDLFQIEDEFLLPRNSELKIVEIGKPEETTTEWGSIGKVIRIKVSYQPPVTKEQRAVPTAQIEPPTHKILNKDPVSAKGADIIVPASPEADALTKIGTDLTPEEIAGLDAKTRPIFTSDPNYKPFNPDQGMTPQREEMLKTLTPTGESVFQYIDSSLKLNKALRTGDLAVETSDQVKHMDEAMRISKHLPPGATVYRMMKLQRWMDLNLKSGQVIFDRGFMSTTMSKDYVDLQLEKNKKEKQVKQIPMRIVMSNNTSGMDLTSVSWFTEENEYLLPRNTGLRFLGWDANGFAVFERVT